MMGERELLLTQLLAAENELSALLEEARRLPPRLAEAALQVGEAAGEGAARRGRDEAERLERRAAQLAELIREARRRVAAAHVELARVEAGRLPALLDAVRECREEATRAREAGRRAEESADRAERLLEGWLMEARRAESEMEEFLARLSHRV